MNIAEGNEPVASNAKAIIRKRALSQAEIARRSGMSPRRLSDIFRGVTVIRAHEILNLSKALDVGIEELFTEGTEANAQAI